MTITQRIFLSFILSLLVLVPAVHSAPYVSVCACVDFSENQSGSSGLDTCLVCQLQAGVQITNISMLSPGGELLGVESIPYLIPMEHSTRISHPPIFS